MPADDPKKGFGRTSDRDSAAAPAGKSWFFGIGINEYQHFPRLNNARKDVTDVLELLQERYELDEYRTIFDEEATRDSIIDQLQELQEQVSEHDKLVIYYSGHGHLDSRDRGYWLPHDAQAGRVASYLRNSAIREFVEDINARHILLISDSCFSGTLLTRNVEMDLPALTELEKDRSRWVMASGRQQEAVADGKPGANSPFTGSVLKVLARNEDTGLNAALLFDKVSKLTRFQYDQMPQSAPMLGAGHEGGQYIFRLKKDEARAYERAQQGDTLAAYSAFLRSYPRGKYAEKALARIVELEEDQAWQKAERADRISDYFQYLHRYPEGRHVEEADQAIERLEKETSESVKDPPARTAARQSKGDKRTDTPKPKAPAAKKADPDTFTDPRDRQTYRTVELNGLRWMAQNLNYDIGEGCWFYDNDPKNGEKYGRLYTWEAAQKACPPGWRLPTDEEWREMAKGFGGVDDLGVDGDEGAYEALIEGGSSGFSAQLGGHRTSDGNFLFLGVDGSYWSATEDDDDYAWHYEFGSGKLRRFSGNKSPGFLCRCVQD